MLYEQIRRSKAAGDVRMVWRCRVETAEDGRRSGGSGQGQAVLIQLPKVPAMLWKKFEKLWCSEAIGRPNDGSCGGSGVLQTSRERRKAEDSS